MKSDTMRFLGRTDLLSNVAMLFLHDDAGQILPLCQAESGCNDSPSPLHQMDPLEMEQHESVWWQLKLLLLSQNAVQWIHDLTPMPYGSLQIKCKSHHISHCFAVDDCFNLHVYLLVYYACRCNLDTVAIVHFSQSESRGTKKSWRCLWSSDGDCDFQELHVK